ncbi:MAG TPA: ribosome-associated translation inhibitor RaiA [Myxococcota bacterium]|nr:ribosome-associated translation inhibitor RaiA [Myxococcota bacterium]HOH76121.1 ribosome-associated translation inhibitor RaiA [Myxococcota bacterium]
MKVNYTLRQFNASDALRELIESKLEKHIGQYLPEEHEIKVTLSMEKSWATFDLMVQFKGETFKAAEKATDIYPVLDVVIEKVARQVAKHRDMIVDKRKR